MCISISYLSEGGGGGGRRILLEVFFFHERFWRGEILNLLIKDIFRCVWIWISLLWFYICVNLLILYERDKREEKGDM